MDNYYLSSEDICTCLFSHPECDAVDITKSDLGIRIFDVLTVDKSKDEVWYIEELNIYLICSQEIKEYFECEISSYSVKLVELGFDDNRPVRS